MEVGQLVGRFRIQRHLGRGGMGDVYLALDTMNFRNVALKVLPRVHQSSRVLLARFLREMEICRKLTHPNVVGLVDSGFDEDQYYIAFEYVIGKSLDDVVAEMGRLQMDSALSILQDISFALHAAHQQNIIHRDVKPGNIMQTDDGTVKLIDFGIAQSKDVRLHRAVRNEMDRIGIRFRESELNTSPGTILGTPCYNSPEMNRGRPADFSSDIYSLGLTFYEMITGVQVLPNQALPKIVEFQGQLDDVLIPPSQLAPDIPAGVEEIITRMVRFNPEDRYQSATELVGAINTILNKGADTEAGTGKAPKNLAQLELSETHYAKAENYLAEGQFVEALDEFLNLLSLPVRQERYSEFIERWMTLLLCVLQPIQGARKTEDAENAKLVPHDEFIQILTKVYAVYQKLGLSQHQRLVATRLVDILNVSRDYEAALETYDELLASYPDDVDLRRGYAEFLHSNGAASAAKRLIYQTVHALLDKQRFADALSEFERIVRMEPDNSRIRQEQEALAAEAKKQEDEFEEFFVQMKAQHGRAPSQQLIKSYTELLKHYPNNRRALEQLAEVYELEKDALAARDARAALAIQDFFDNSPLAKDNLIKCLLQDKDYTLGHLYLAEVYRREGHDLERADNYSDLLILLYTLAGFFEDSLREYQKRLRGSLDDLETYQRMLDLLRQHGQRQKLHEVYFAMGECALKHERYDLAKDYFDQAIERAPDRRELNKRLRGVPHINKVYNMLKLAMVGMIQQPAQSTANQRGEKHDTRGLSSFLDGMRRGAGGEAAGGGGGDNP